MSRIFEKDGENAKNPFDKEFISQLKQKMKAKYKESDDEDDS